MEKSNLTKIVWSVIILVIMCFAIPLFNPLIMAGFSNIAQTGSSQTISCDGVNDDEADCPQYDDNETGCLSEVSCYYEISECNPLTCSDFMSNETLCDGVASCSYNETIVPSNFLFSDLVDPSNGLIILIVSAGWLVILFALIYGLWMQTLNK